MVDALTSFATELTGGDHFFEQWTRAVFAVAILA